MKTEEGPDLSEVRARIDGVDRALVELLGRREELVREVGRMKTTAASVRAPDRVEQVISKVRTLASELGSSPDVVERTYRAMIDAFIDLELKVQAGHA